MKSKTTKKTEKKPLIGIASLGCPKATVDSERIMTKLLAEGYEFALSYDEADLVIVNTCGFLDSAKKESIEAIEEALKENGKVIVTGCLGVEPELIKKHCPKVAAITRPHQYDDVVAEVHKIVPPPHNPFLDLVPPQGLRLTPPHYAYLKISEGCNNSCSFCIIPSIRGKMISRPLDDIMLEAKNLVDAGTNEILVISQDTSAYGNDLGQKSALYKLCSELGDLGAWIRLHYIYPYPNVDEIIPLMEQGKILPYLDIPFQHASPKILKAMKRPGNQEKTLDNIKKWRKICPELAIRSTFIVGFPDETEEDFEMLLSWLKEARLDRVGCFTFEPVKGAAASSFDNQIPEEVKQERLERFMLTQQEISTEILQNKVGKILEVIIDEVDDEGAIARSYADAPEIDGNVFIDEGQDLEVGEIVTVKISESSEYDLWGDLV